MRGTTEWATAGAERDMAEKPSFHRALVQIQANFIGPLLTSAVVS